MRLGFDAKRVFHNTTGLGNYGRDVLRILRARFPGHGYFAYSPRPSAAPAVAAAEGAALELRGPRDAIGRAVPALWRQRGIVSDLAADRIDLFHGLTNELPSGIESTRIATVVTIHDLIFERFPALYPPIDRRIYRWKFRSAARRARVVVAASEETRRDLLELYGVDPARIRVVYQTCHPAFRAAPDPALAAALRERLRLPSSFLLAVGTLEERKNLALVLRALVKLPDVSLVAVGRPTPYAQRLAAFVEANGLSGRVRFLQGLSMPELAALYRLADAAVYCSRVEGFGIPVLEAITAGTPVVTTRGGVFPEVGGDAAAYVDPDDADELRGVLEGILSDPARRARMREAGLAHAARFRDEVIADGLMAVYEEALRA
jgi:glycosyltransferase involved in cell wall biosynthesis